MEKMLDAVGLSGASGTTTLAGSYRKDHPVPIDVDYELAKIIGKMEIFALLPKVTRMGRAIRTTKLYDDRART
jgi:hypothetical protein